MSTLVTRFGATEFESVGLGAPSLEVGIAFLLEKTGLTATPLPSAQGAWNSSAVLHTHSGAVIEVLAPHPDFRGLNHLGAELARLPLPQLVFWTVQTPDFDAAVQQTAALGHPLEQTQTQTIDVDGFRQSGKIGRLGPGENMIRPVLSAQDVPPTYPIPPDPACTATALHLSHWEAPPLNRLLDGLGLTLRATPGAPSLRLDLRTPKGPVTLESGDWVKGGTSQVIGRLGRSMRHLVLRR
jgi:hypothetical protein